MIFHIESSVSKFIKLKLAKDSYFSFSMTQIQQRQDSEFFIHQDKGSSISGASSFNVEGNIVQSIKGFIQNYGGFESGLDFDKRKTAQDPHDNPSENTDKKSLLTELLKESQILSENEDTVGAHEVYSLKEQRRPLSHREAETQKMKNGKLLREIDFANYRIESISGKKRKEKNVRQRNCGQCSKCNLF